MHSALAIVDVIALILSYIDCETTLAALARTCVTLSDAALDKLWRSVDVVALARCMPEHVWDEVESDDALRFYSGVAYRTTILSLRDVNGMDDWLGPRFKGYTARVHCLNIQDRVVERRTWSTSRLPIHSSGPSPSRSPAETQVGDSDGQFRSFIIRSTLGPNIMLAWLESAGANRLFPRLSHIKWSIKSRADLDVARLLLGPHLTHLTFVPSSDVPFGAGPVSSMEAEIAGAIVDEALSVCPCLRHVGLFGGLDILHEGMGTSYASTLPLSIAVRLQNLRALHCGVQITDVVMQQVARLPQLVSCRVVVSPELKLDYLPAVFPAVHDLHLWRTTLDHACSLLSSITSPAVHVLELCPDREPRPSQYCLLFRVLAEQRSLNSLQQLIVAPKFHKWQNIRGRAAGLPVVDFMPLLGLARLCHVELKTLHIHPDHALIQCLDGKVWPSLKKLRIGRGLCATLADLDRVARIYPWLEECTVTIDVTHGAKLPDIGSSDFTHPRFRRMYLSIQGSDMRLAARHRAPVAYYLVTVFPYATFCGYDDRLLDLLRIAQPFAAMGNPWSINRYESFVEAQDNEG